MDGKLNAEGDSAKRSSYSDPKFGGIQLRDVDSGTITRMTNARRHVLKVAIHTPNSAPQLYEINQKLSLKENIRDFCDRWNIDNSEQYALQHFDNFHYITEESRNEVRDGAVLRLAISPAKITAELMQLLKNAGSKEEKLQALKQLSKASSDPTFAFEFIRNSGLSFLVTVIEKSVYHSAELAYALTTFLEVMDHGLVEWDAVLSNDFIKVVARHVNLSGNVDATILQRALGILECAVVNSNKYDLVIAEVVNVGNLVSHLQRSNSEIQLNTIALLNSLFLKAPAEKGRVAGRRNISDTMVQKQFRSTLLNHVIRTSKSIGPEMLHQLHILQVLTLNTMEPRLHQRLDPLNQEDRDKLFELRTIAFDSSQLTQHGAKRTQGHAAFNSSDFKKLGFTNHNNPVLDFEKTPPGVLALDMMIYFARHQQDNYVKLVLENSSRGDKHECPFGRSSIEITKKLCDILRIGEQPTEVGQDVYPMFFSHDHAFEEFFCICIQLFNKTWKEMSAIKDDFDKVMSVFQDQVIITLADKSSSLDSFRHKLSGLPYSAILKKREQEREDKEQFDSQAAPVLELQEQVKPEIIDLIRQQRLNFMEKGTVFHKISNKRRDKSRWCCRLSPNHKLFCYGDIDENDDVSGIESLPEQLVVANIKDLVVGKHCPHVKHTRTHKTTTDLAFSILSYPDEYLNFVAPSRETWCMWTDGVNALLGREMKSGKARSDLDVLLSMEMKLRMLDLENIPIPDQPPEIPPLPKNYNFVHPT